MYTGFNFKEKDDLLAAVAGGKKITVFRPRRWKDFVGLPPVNGKISIEGPHRVPWVQGFPTHEWFAKAVIENGLVIRVE